MLRTCNEINFKFKNNRVTYSREKMGTLVKKLLVRKYLGFLENEKQKGVRILSHLQIHVNLGFAKMCANPDLNA